MRSGLKKEWRSGAALSPRSALTAVRMQAHGAAGDQGDARDEQGGGGARQGGEGGPGGHDGKSGERESESGEG